MTQEDKDLLRKDLSARLYYRVKCHFKYGSAEGDVTLSCIDNNVARFEYGWYGRFHVSIDADYIKPYLRPMSSMTEEEKKIFLGIRGKSSRNTIGTFVPNGTIDREYKVDCIVCSLHNYSKNIDWLNAHHFDYRGLIEKGLAIEAPKDMYK